jgi:hypothetical protein
MRLYASVDTSGDSDLCFRAGVPFQPAGEDGPVQSSTTTFRLGNVDGEQARQQRWRWKKGSVVRALSIGDLQQQFRRDIPLISGAE